MSGKNKITTRTFEIGVKMYSADLHVPGHGWVTVGLQKTKKQASKIASLAKKVLLRDKMIKINGRIIVDISVPAPVDNRSIVDKIMDAAGGKL